MKVSNRIFRQSCLFRELAPGDTFTYLAEVYIKAMTATRPGTIRYFAVRLRDGISLYDWDDSKSLYPLKLKAVPLDDTDDINE